MGRAVYEIHFNCKCGNSHFTFTNPKGILNPTAPVIPAIEFYGEGRLPDDLKSFLAKPFVCPNNPEITELPDLDAFFLQYTGSATTLV